VKRPQLVWIGLAVAGLVALVVLGIVVISSSAPEEPAPTADAPAARRPLEVDVPGAFVVKKNGGWGWFQDERAIVDGGKLLVGTVAGTTRDGTKAGDVQLTTFELDSKKATTTTLHAKLQSADHASPSIVRLADGRYLSAYARQGKDGVVRWRVTDKPGDTSKWKPEQKLEVKGKVTYTNLALEPGEKGRLFNFYRGGDLPRVMVAAEGTDFTDVGDWVTWGRKSPSFDAKRSTRPSEARPYVRFASRGGKVHFILTEDHPRSYDTSVYHGYLAGHVLHDSAGAVLDEDIRTGEPIALTRLTRVYEGTRDDVPWIVDVDVDAEGHPFAAIVVQKDGQKRSSKKEGGGKDLRYRFARWDGKAWSSDEIGHAGSALYGAEANFSGLVALVPKNPDVIFLSANVDPATGKADEGTRRYELHRGVTKDRGKTWTFTAITKDSQVDNIRPIVPEWDKGTVVLWLRGSYTSMTRFDLDVIGMLDPGAEAPKGK
jgi:hypothetical protein